MFSTVGLQEGETSHHPLGHSSTCSLSGSLSLTTNVPLTPTLPPRNNQVFGLPDAFPRTPEGSESRGETVHV